MYENSTEEIIKAQNNEEEAMDNLVIKNSGLIWSIVKRFCGRGYDAEDLYQIGCIGFIKAIKRFDASFEVKMSTYAVPYILGEIKRFLRDDNPIKVSRSVKELSMKIKHIQQEYLVKNGEEINIHKIAEILNTTKEEIAIAIDYTNPIESIDETVEDEQLKIEKINTHNQDETTKIIEKMILKEAIEKLNAREKQIIILRYFRDKTQSQVAKMIGITQVQVSRIEKKILTNMREKLIG